MIGILFVDDEPAILRALKFVLTKESREWRLVFVQSGEAALEELEKSSFDVIVSDLRMPGMDGSELLERVREKHPHVARIVLSGHADAATVARVQVITENFLSKPCPPDTLRASIRKALARGAEAGV